MIAPKLVFVGKLTLNFFRFSERVLFNVSLVYEKLTRGIDCGCKLMWTAGHAIVRVGKLWTDTNGNAETSSNWIVG